MSGAALFPIAWASACPHGLGQALIPITGGSSGIIWSLVFLPGPGRAEGCDLQPVTAEPPIILSYATSTVPRGCVSNSSLDTGHEVHVLSVRWSKASPVPLMVTATPRDDTCSRSAVLVLLCARCSASITSPCSNLIIRTDAHLSPEAIGAPNPEPPMVSSKEQLLTWALATYGGITSYSELQDPRRVQLHLGEDARSPPECIPQEHFNAILHLETEVFFHGVKSCSRSDAQSSRAAHIIHLQSEPSSPIKEVNLSLSCPEKSVGNQMLILQSKANFTWSLSLKCYIQLLVSGSYRMVPLFPTLFPGVLLPDTEQDLIAKAFEKNYSVIASYSAIPASTHISLEIQGHEMAKTPVTTTPLVITQPPDLPHQVLLTLKPWKCTDETMEIVIIRSYLEPIKDVVNITLRDISCQAEKNATHFMLKSPLSHCGTSLEGRGYANNELILSLAKDAVLRSVRVGFQCEIPRELFLRLFPTAAFEAPQTELEINKEAFVQASMRWMDHPADLQLKECWLVASGKVAVLLVQGGEARGAGVAVLEGPPSSHGRKVWRFRFTYTIPEDGHIPFSAMLKCKAGLQNDTIFEKVLEVTVKDAWRPLSYRGLGLAAVLGITFGAFLIGALLTAGLWYIYSHTRPISKLQPVSSTAPASESSSTNHSIGSTQSTPCSTSSMA
ncbi:PREDICTED: endoglin [Corvus brachyrhynchos]|uniref:endoglin n=1 Tax=Corvus brachyrhynchos TaxID=85066 RepID=UPI0008166777|nr:PREDICTED: endoglin [Corvus brachyrhynchos]